MCVCVCVRAKGQGTVWIKPDNAESMRHVVGQAQYAERVLQGVVVCIGGSIYKGSLG